MATNTPNYDIDPNDERFTTVTDEKDAALTDLENTYGGMISDSDKYYQQQIDASKQWAETQKKNQQAQTDFAIEQINQQKQQAKEDYTKEQSGAYVDWQKQSNAYGANAEAMAAQGMTNTGYSESSQVSMYNTYQQRVVASRDAYTRAVLNYDNAIKEARLQNNSILAEIAYNALQQQLTLSLEGFQYKNTLLLDKVEKKTALEEMYHQRWQDVLKQINTDNALKEEVRQHNAQLELEREKFNYQKEQAAKASAKASVKSGGSGSSSGSSGSSNINKGSAAGAAKGSGSGTSDLKVDTDSLVKAGYAGKSAAFIDAAVKSGKLVETEKNGKLYYYLPRDAFILNRFKN